MVLGLVIILVSSAPQIFMIEKAVTGHNGPIIDKLPMNGSNSSHILAQTIVLYPQSLFFSGETSSVVDVVRIESVDETVTLATIDVASRRNTLSDPVTARKHKFAVIDA